ncbi:MAG: GDSL-type esterase/lipase family protein [Candidatus Saganbacteria bacterium]|nr:GDSL-type esterase/lipase family protein [Candidatus Saganbacteria bacterium]
MYLPEQRSLKLLVFCLLLILPLSGCAPSPDFSGINNFYSAKGKNLICFGDSLTAGVGAGGGEGEDIGEGEGKDYPSILGRNLSIPVINSGRSGDLTFTAIDRIWSDVLPKDPKIVIVELGANDFLSYGSAGPPGKTTEDTFKNLEYIVDKIEESGAVVVIAGIPFSEEYKKGYEELAKKKKAILIPDIMKGILGSPDLMSPDRIHPNAKGYKVMAENFLAVLRPLLKEMEK